MHVRHHPITARVAAVLIRILCRTLRFEFRDEAGILDPARKGPIIWLMWHNRILVVPYIRHRWLSHRKGVVLTSPSRDGGVLAGVVQAFGLAAERGSSSRRGASALLALGRWIEGGGDVAITPDGPRGPRYRLGAGAVLLSQKTGAPLLLLGVEYSSAWRLRSWDGFFIPRPFARVRVTFSEPFVAEPTADDAAFEAERLRIEARLADLRATD
jgi:lysophospholipid acyltransferase (LPLAT)-like uncharacterized protein